MKHPEETTRIPPPAEKRPSEGCMGVSADHEHMRDPEQTHRVSPTRAETPKSCVKVPEGDERERGLLSTPPPCAILSTMTSLLFVLKQHRWLHQFLLLQEDKETEA